MSRNAMIYQPVYPNKKCRFVRAFLSATEKPGTASLNPLKSSHVLYCHSATDGQLSKERRA